MTALAFVDVQAPAVGYALGAVVILGALAGTGLLALAFWSWIEERRGGS